jgi:hypothetical protein
LSCGGYGIFWGFAFRVKEVDEVFDLIGLENVAEGGHGSAAVLDLVLDFFFF